MLAVRAVTDPQAPRYFITYILAVAGVGGLRELRGPYKEAEQVIQAACSMRVSGRGMSDVRVLREVLDEAAECSADEPSPSHAWIAWTLHQLEALSFPTKGSAYDHLKRCFDSLTGKK